MSESRQCKSKGLEGREILIFRGYSKVNFSKAISLSVRIWETKLMSLWYYLHVNFISESRQCTSKGLQDTAMIIYQGNSKVNYSLEHISRCVGIWETKLMTLWCHFHVNFMSDSRQCTCKCLEERDILIIGGYSKVNFSKAIYLSVRIWATQLMSLWGIIFIIVVSESRQCMSKDLEIETFKFFEIIRKSIFVKANISRSVGIWETKLMLLWGNV
jgi:hypothetical protein